MKRRRDAEIPPTSQRSKFQCQRDFTFTTVYSVYSAFSFFTVFVWICVV